MLLLDFIENQKSKVKEEQAIVAAKKHEQEQQQAAAASSAAEEAKGHWIFDRCARSGGNFDIDDTEKVLTKRTRSWKTFRTKKNFSENCKSITFRVEDDGSRHDRSMGSMIVSGNMQIGVIPSNADVTAEFPELHVGMRKAHSINNFSGWSCGREGKLEGEFSKDNFAVDKENLEFSAGSYVTVSIDLDKHTISFSNNSGLTSGYIFKAEGLKKYSDYSQLCPAVALLSEGQSVQIAETRTMFMPQEAFVDRSQFETAKNNNDDDADAATSDDDGDNDDDSNVNEQHVEMIISDFQMLGRDLSRKQVVRALNKHNGDLKTAIKYILSN